MIDYFSRKIYFTTITIENWVKIFDDFPRCKSLILDSFNYLVHSNKCSIYAFVIMEDHLHLIWEHKEHDLKTNITNFKSFTSKTILAHISKIDADYSQNFQSERKDRAYKIWKLETRSTKIIHKDIFIQKLEYIHQNPTQGEYQKCSNPEDYKFSSSHSYKSMKAKFEFLEIFKLT